MVYYCHTHIIGLAVLKSKDGQDRLDSCRRVRERYHEIHIINILFLVAGFKYPLVNYGKSACSMGTISMGHLNHINLLNYQRLPLEHCLVLLAIAFCSMEKREKDNDPSLLNVQLEMGHKTWLGFCVPIEHHPTVGDIISNTYTYNYIYIYEYVSLR